MVRVFQSKPELGSAAARQAGSILEQRIREAGRARIILSAGNSQLEMIDALARLSGPDWRAVEVFHVDEYVGLPALHPASFRLWVKTRFADRVSPGAVHYLAGDASDVEEECRRYAALLSAMPIDIAFLGFGENGHIGFNDPHEANFADPLAVRPVTLDERCRRQQVGEGHFPDLASVPQQAVTLTCPTLVSASYIICCVPDQRKAEAVKNALEGPVTPACPASIVRTHAQACLYLDRDSASLLAAR
ncbi:MAG: glucosamine-6-phosphate deaminase [Bryobacteraceae bacterium]|jgi:glucosamine-6-phosphate deaminase